MEHGKQGRSALAMSAADAPAWRRTATTDSASVIADAADDDATFAGTPEELDALMRGGGSGSRAQPRRWPLAVALLIIVAGSLLLWGGLFLLLR